MSGKSRPKRLVAVDWDVRTLRLIHASMGKRGVKIDRLLSVAIPPGVDPANPEQMGRHIRRTLDQEGIATRHAIVDIPRDQAILKTLKLPAAKPGELPGMVEIQIAKELPFPVSEAVIDFTVSAGDGEAATSDVLVAAVRHEQLEQYDATFAVAGLRLDRIGLRPYANKVAVCELLRHALPERVLFIDVRPTFMEIDVLRDSALAFSRSASVVIPTGLGQSSVVSISGSGQREPPPSPKEVTDDVALTIVDEPTAEAAGPGRVIHSLVLEVTRSIEAYRASDAGGAMDHVVIGGDLGVEDALAEAIQKRLNITTEIYNPASTFGWEPDEGAAAAAFAASLGLVLGHAEDGTLHFDFLHPKRSVSQTTERLKKAPMAAAVVLFFAAAVAVGFTGYTRADRKTLADLEEKIERLENRQRDFKKFLKLVDEDIEAFDAGQHVWVDVLYDVFSALPSNQEMLLGRMEMNQKDGRLALKTRAKQRDTAIDVIRRLNEFQREGRDLPRFKAGMGPQSEKKKDRYPFAQDLRITVLDDEPGKKANTKGSSRG